MDQYRKHYQKFSDPKKESHVDFDFEEEDEDDNMEYNSDNDDDNDLVQRERETKTTEVGNKSRLETGNNVEDDEDEEDEVDDSDNNRSPSVRDSFEFGLAGSPSKEESADSMDAVRDSFCDSPNDSGADSGGYENGDSVGEETKSTRNKRKERFEQEYLEEDGESEAPVYYFDDVFFNVCSVSNLGEADEQDVLIIGHHPIQTYLDIRDKDFFNVTNGDDAGNGHVHARAMSHLEDSIHHPLSETVEEFYSGIGIDTEYF